MAFENPYDQKIKYKATNKIKGLTALRNHIIVRDMNFSGRTLSSGIVLLSDDGSTTGIRPRWAKVYAVGPEQTEIQVGQWVYIEHGRWTRGMNIELEDTGEEITIRRVDPDGIIFVSDTEPSDDDTMSSAVDGERKSRTNWAEE